MPYSKIPSHDPVAVLREALEKIERNQIEVFDEDTGGNVLVCMDAEEMRDIASAALATTERAARTVNASIGDDGDFRRLVAKFRNLRSDEHSEEAYLKLVAHIDSYINEI